MQKKMFFQKRGHSLKNYLPQKLFIYNINFKCTNQSLFSKEKETRQLYVIQIKSFVLKDKNNVFHLPFLTIYKMRMGQLCSNEFMFQAVFQAMGYSSELQTPSDLGMGSLHSRDMGGEEPSIDNSCVKQLYAL